LPDILFDMSVVVYIFPRYKLYFTGISAFVSPGINALYPTIPPIYPAVDSKFTVLKHLSTVWELYPTIPPTYSLFALIFPVE